MFFVDPRAEEVITFSRLNPESPFSSVSQHYFELEDHTWPSAEHYYQWKKFKVPKDQNKILSLQSGLEVNQWANHWSRFGKVTGWKKQRRLMMTRALYSKTIQNSDVLDELLATGDEDLKETSLYDHFWGIGRDQRGENTMGKIWMEIRAKIRADQAEN
jgi:ribA/ribD-fused uncharacterized protein